MNLKDFYSEVARRADTSTQKITAADTSRVLSVAFQVLGGLDNVSLLAVLSKGLEKAKKKAAK